MEAGLYFLELAQERRRRPADDMISRLTQVEVDRGDGQMTQLDDAEIAGFVSLLGGAGAETVTKLVGNAAVLFHRNPDQYAKVVEDPGQGTGGGRGDPALLPSLPVPGAIFGPGFAVQRRHRAGRPPDHPRHRFGRHETSASTSGPDRFDIDRPASLALGFGYGVHSCLGAALARMESRIAIEELARRWPRFEVDEANCVRVQMSNVAGYASVPTHRTG